MDLDARPSRIADLIDEVHERADKDPIGESSGVIVVYVRGLTPVKIFFAYGFKIFSPVLSHRRF
jgi:hypothetical protein